MLERAIRKFATFASAGFGPSIRRLFAKMLELALDGRCLAEGQAIFAIEDCFELFFGDQADDRVDHRLRGGDVVTEVTEADDVAGEGKLNHVVAPIGPQHVMADGAALDAIERAIFAGMKKEFAGVHILDDNAAAQSSRIQFPEILRCGLQNFSRGKYSP